MFQAKIEDLSAQAQTQAAEQFTRRPETEQIQSKATVGETTSDIMNIDWILI